MSAPTKWEINRQSNNVNRVGGGFVASLNHVNLADARLIAAAPDLLEALRWLISSAAPTAEEKQWPEIAAALAAIAKATE